MAEFDPELRNRSLKLLVILAEKKPEIARSLALSLCGILTETNSEHRLPLLVLLGHVAAHSPAHTVTVARRLPALLCQHSQERLVQIIATAISRGSSLSVDEHLRVNFTSATGLAAEAEGSSAFTELRQSLTMYARAHCGEDVRIHVGSEKSFTDGRRIFLPKSFGLEPELEALAFRILTARNAGHIEFGLLELDLSQLDGPWKTRESDELERERLFRSFSNHSLAGDLFSILENFRIEACLRAEYPGVARDMDLLNRSWRPEIKLRADPSSLEIFVDSLRRHAQGLPTPAILSDDVKSSLTSSIPILRALGSHSDIHDSVRSLLELYPFAARFFMKSAVSDYIGMEADPGQARVDTSRMSDADRRTEIHAQQILEELRAAGDPADIKEIRRQLNRPFSEISDFLDRFPPPGGPMREDGDVRHSVSAERKKLRRDSIEIPGSHTYPEWDRGSGTLKMSWTHVQEYRITEGPVDFVDDVRLKYQDELRNIRRIFESIKADSLRPMKNRSDGDTIDFDRMIAHRIERKSGELPDPNFYIRRQLKHRDNSVAFLLDLSSSTNEIANAEGKRIIDVEKEALVLVSEAASAVGDDFAIYGFSGFGRDQVAFYVVKDFDEDWNSVICRRIGRLAWKMENRDGAAIRHCTSKLMKARGGKKMMILFSDGKPLDCGCPNYTEEYAQEDTQAALLEARRLGLRAFCITVDPYGQDYLEKMYGPENYLIIDSVESLPSRLPKIYRRLRS